MVATATKINIPESEQKRIVIVGGGFAGLTLARRLAKTNYQIVLIDRNNFHQFQPLFYQVAMAGLEPSSIAFPFRKLFHGRRNIFLRMTEVTAIEPERNRIITPLGYCNYDYLVLALGAETNYFGNEKVKQLALGMKSVSEALYLRNTILADYETALTTMDFNQRQGLLDVVIVGGGPTGVELAGSLAEMRKYILPKDYPELALQEEMDIYLLQGGPQLLVGMSEESSRKSLEYLRELGVKVMLDTRVVDYDGDFVYTKDGQQIRARKVIWAAGVRGSTIAGLPESVVTRGNRYKVDRFNRVEGFHHIFAIGDIAFMTEPNFPEGHPQVAQVAIQQGKQLARNLINEYRGKAFQEFSYNDKGSMATIGRARAVVDLPRLHFNGLAAWLVWLLVHLFSILGARNKLFVFLNWLWNYISYDQSLRLIIRPHSTPPQSAGVEEKVQNPEVHRVSVGEEREMGSRGEKESG